MSVFNQHIPNVSFSRVVTTLALTSLVLGISAHAQDESAKPAAPVANPPVVNAPVATPPVGNVQPRELPMSVPAREGWAAAFHPDGRIVEKIQGLGLRGLIAARQGGVGAGRDFNEWIRKHKPSAMIVDLDGDGRKGSDVDEILYALFFGDLLEQEQLAVTPGGGDMVLEQRRFAEETLENFRQIQRGLTRVNIYLPDRLENGGEDYALHTISMNRLLSRAYDPAYGEQRNQWKEDREKVVSALLTFFALNPALATAEGPAVIGMPGRTSTRGYRKRMRDLHASVNGVLDRHPRISEARDFFSGGSPLALRASVARFATNMILAQFAIEQGVELNERAYDALRASVYMLGFEIRRSLNFSALRSRLMSEIIEQTAQYAPRAMQLTARKSVEDKEWGQLEQRILSLMPIIMNNREPRMTEGTRRRLSLSAAIAAVGAYSLAGAPGADVLLSSDLWAQFNNLAFGSGSDFANFSGEETAAQLATYSEVVAAHIPHALIAATAYSVTSRHLTPEKLISDSLKLRNMIPTYREAERLMCEFAIAPRPKLVD